jgi:hypothetical protein
VGVATPGLTTASTLLTASGVFTWTLAGSVVGVGDDATTTACPSGVGLGVAVTTKGVIVGALGSFVAVTTKTISGAGV